MIKRALAHVSPEELLLIPVVILVILGVILQPTAITRLFETPYATPIPGDSPADEVLNERTPSPTASPASVERVERYLIGGNVPIVYDRDTQRWLVQRSEPTFEPVRRLYIPAPVLSGR